MTASGESTRGAPKERIAVLGGGCGALAAVFALTDEPGWQDRYEITVYERGWRLGGKGASGVNLVPGRGARIEEHGLHVWSGFYENAFWMMRRCYEELGRPASAPLATWQKAFHRHDYGGFRHREGSVWYNWTSYLPHAPGLPGDLQSAALARELAERYGKADCSMSDEGVTADVGGDVSEGAVSTPWDYFRALLPWAIGYLQSAPLAQADARPRRTPSRFQRWLFGDEERRRDPVGKLKFLAETIAAGVATSVLRLALYLTRFEMPASQAPGRLRAPLLRVLLCAARRWIAYNLSRSMLGADKQRSYILADTAVAMMRGLLDGDALTQGFDGLDEAEFSEWLAASGAHAKTLASGTVLAVYSYLFAFEDGAWSDAGSRRIAAGVGLRMTLRLLFDSRGSVFWMMQAGMGDTVFAPLYEVLARRGVRFRFFHRVRRLGSHHGDAIDEIEVRVQARIKDAALTPADDERTGADDSFGQADRYAPLIDIDGLPCWPAQPRYELLVEGEDMYRHFQARSCDIDSAYTDWEDVGQAVLTRGVDFDHVITGIPVGALEYVAGELLPLDAALRNASQNLRTTATQSVQLWLSRDLPALGWHLPPPVLTSYELPFDTWADMSHLLEREKWSSNSRIRSLAYLVGPMEFSAAPPGANPELQADALGQVKESAREWLKNHAHGYWPDAAPDGPGSFDWSVLGAEPREDAAADNFDAQFFKANIDPSERYVLSLPGTSKYRPEPDGTSFSNLLLAGDWTRNGLNYGCVEAAVIGGFKAARCLCGWPSRIHGEQDVPGQPLTARPAPDSPPRDTTREVRPGPAMPPAQAVPEAAAYVRRGGIHTMPPPWRTDDVDMFVFYLEADRDVLQSLCDRVLNAPSGNTYRFEPTSRFVLLTYQHFGKLRSMASGYDRAGYLTEREAAFWVFVEDANGTHLPGGNTWLSLVPYMVTDDATAVLCGREVFGFPKELGEVSMQDGTPPFRVAARTFGLQDAANPVALHELVRVARAKLTTGDDTMPIFSDVKPLSGDPYNPELAQYIADDDLLTMLKQLMDMMRRGRLDFVFLKQMRALAGGEGADSSMIGLAHQENLEIKLADVLLADHRVSLPRFDSHPVAEDLGLRLEASTRETDVALAIRVKVSFDFMPGTVHRRSG